MNFNASLKRLQRIHIFRKMTDEGPTYGQNHEKARKEKGETDVFGGRIVHFAVFLFVRKKSEKTLAKRAEVR